MIYKTYIDKFSTIVENSDLNSGINPVAELMYGNEKSRLLLHFNHNGIKAKIDDGVFADKTKMKHYLRITNASSLDFTEVHCNKFVSSAEKIKRSSSFDLIFFLIPEEWDGGKGFNMFKLDQEKGDFIYRFNGRRKPYSDLRLISKDGSTWYQARNGYKWEEPGIYSTEKLSKEYESYDTEEGSAIVFARQYFDIGNENINLDITDIVNKFIDGELTNYGIGIAYSPKTEFIEDGDINYCGFLTHKTNTFFEPYVETVYDDYISDDRGTFTLNKNNRLYLYCNIGGKTTNLDETPICEIDGIEYNVVHQTKGIYYAEVLGNKDIFKSNTMYYDIWKNIKYQGVDMGEIEMDFVVNNSNNFFNFGNTLDESIHFEPTIYGIKEGEEIKRGDLRKITILARQNYTKNKANIVDNMEYRIYIKDGTRELDIFNGPVNRTVKENFFLVDTSIMLPQRYYVDIKFLYNMEEITHHNVLSFDIVDDLNNKYA